MSKENLVIEFDMTGYHPGTCSMTGWLINHFMLPDGNPSGEYSILEIWELKPTIRIRNFHKIGFVNPLNIKDFLLDIQGLIQHGFRFEIEEIPYPDNYWQPVR